MEPGRLPCALASSAPIVEETSLSACGRRLRLMFSKAASKRRPGTYDLQVTTATGASADEVVTVVADSRDGVNPGGERRRVSTDCGIDWRSGGRGFRFDPSRAPLARPDERGGRTADSSGAVDGDSLTLRRVARGGVDNSKAAGACVGFQGSGIPDP